MKKFTLVILSAVFVLSSICQNVKVTANTRNQIFNNEQIEYKQVPQDLNVYINAFGEMIIETSEENYINGLLDSSKDFPGMTLSFKTNISLKNVHRFSYDNIYTSNCQGMSDQITKINSTSAKFVPSSNMDCYGGVIVKNIPYSVTVNSDGYHGSRKFDVTFTNGYKAVPQDLQIEYTDNKLYIYTNDSDYLNSFSFAQLCKENGYMTDFLDYVSMTIDSKNNRAYFDLSGKTLNDGIYFIDANFRGYVLSMFYINRTQREITYHNTLDAENSNVNLYINDGSKIQLLDLYKNGKEFEGWFLDNEYKTKITEIDTSVDRDLDIYAKWKTGIVNKIEFSTITPLIGERVDNESVLARVNGETTWSTIIPEENIYFIWLDENGNKPTIFENKKYYLNIGFKLDTNFYTLESDDKLDVMVNGLKCQRTDGEDLNISFNEEDSYKYYYFEREFECNKEPVNITKIDIKGINEIRAGLAKNIDIDDLEIKVNGIEPLTDLDIDFCWTNGKNGEQVTSFEMNKDYYLNVNLKFDGSKTSYRFLESNAQVTVNDNECELIGSKGLGYIYSEISYVSKFSVKTGNYISFEKLTKPDKDIVYVNGNPCELFNDGTVDLINPAFNVVTTYEINDPTKEDKHEIYPTSMKVYLLEDDENGNKKAVYHEEFDDILKYAGASIRIKGNKGIRIITSIPTEKKNKLINDGIDNYKVMEYGTVMCWASDLAENEEPTLTRQNDGSFKATHGAKGRAYSRTDNLYTIYKEGNGITQFTNTLVGNYTNQQCASDFAMRSYMIIRPKDAVDNEKDIVIYGGTLFRSISFVAYQNRNAFNSGTEEYEYIWNLIKAGYGDKYDNEYEN